MTVKSTYKGLSIVYTGPNGEAVLTRNSGNKDKNDRWSVSVVVKGEYKRLATRAEFSKAYKMAENAIG